MVQHRDIQDPDTGGQYTIKLYESEKTVGQSDDSWMHTRILLKPVTSVPGYETMVFDVESAMGLKVIAELVAVLG